MSEGTGRLIELTVDVDGEAAEAVAELFERYGGGAVVEIDVTPGPESGRSLVAPITHVRTYIAADDVEARARLEVGLWHLGRLYPIPEASVRELSRANWAEAWREHFTPQRIGERFVVVPSWSDYEARPDDILIVLDPGMCFGTGLHPTTRLCLMALEEWLRPGDRVVDIGTGTGILAIGAALLGARRVVALDISSEAVTTAAANAQRNGVAIETFAGQLAELPAETFDLALANLLSSTIMGLASELARRLVDGGHLVASGILLEQGDETVAALLGVGFEIVATPSSGDWLAIIARRGSR